MTARAPACWLFLVLDLAIGGCKSAATAAPDGSAFSTQIDGGGGGGGSGDSAGGGTGDLADSGAIGAGDSGLPTMLDAKPTPADALMPMADTTPLSCEQRLADLNAKRRPARVCEPQSPLACKGAVEDLCGCMEVVADPSSAATRAFVEAVQAYKTAGCIAPCPEAGACPPTTGFCASAGQERNFHCSS